MAMHTSQPLLYQRKADHVPNTQAENETYYVLTLHTNAAHHGTMTAMRRRFFPARLNKLDAHVALFRALPESQMDAVIEALDSLKFKTASFPIRATDVFRLNKGVAVTIDDGGRSRAIHEALKKQWHSFLSKQDQSYRPHYTVANKLTGEEDVHQCLEDMRTVFHGSEGMVKGLALYRYDRGWWVDEKVFWLQGNTTNDANQ